MEQAEIFIIFRHYSILYYFFIIGLWHATTIQFIICGTLFGLGTSINKAYQAIMVKIYGKNKYHQYQKIYYIIIYLADLQ